MVDEASKILEEIASGRAELAETVQALVQRADVKARVREKVSDNADHLSERASQVGALARELTQNTAESGKSAVDAVGRSTAGYLVFGAFGLLLLMVLLRRLRS